MLKMVPEPRGDCFKLWVIQSRSCFRHSPRSHIGDALWNSEPDSRHNSHNAFGQLFWFSGKCVFVQKVLQRIIQNTPRKGPGFGHMGICMCLYTLLAWICVCRYICTTLRVCTDIHMYISKYTGRDACISLCVYTDY